MLFFYMMINHFLNGILCEFLCHFTCMFFYITHVWTLVLYCRSTVAQLSEKKLKIPKFMKI